MGLECDVERRDGEKDGRKEREERGEERRAGCSG